MCVYFKDILSISYTKYLVLFFHGVFNTAVFFYKAKLYNRKGHQANRQNLHLGVQQYVKWSTMCVCLNPRPQHDY